MKINNTDLTQLIESCFDLSMDGRVDGNYKRDFLALGKRLRGSLLNLLTAQFSNDTKAVIDANNQLRVLNQYLVKIKQDLENIVQVITQLGSLVSILDDLLKIASTFA